MMTAQSIPAASADGYAGYLESRTVAPERGDYYLGSDGAPAEAPGRWLTSPEVLAILGVATTDEIDPEDLRALMAGRQPGDGDKWLRRAGADGQRAGGIDVTFSAPKSVSVVWALANADERELIESAHHVAVKAAVDHLRDTVPTTTRWDAAQRRNVAALARELHAAEFLHTTARGAAGSVPDPQLHSHVVITSVQRADGSVGAVRSRPVLRSAREIGAHYRASLANELRQLGFATEQADPKERYFRVRGVSAEVERAFSKRTAEIHRAAQQFRAEHGREPIRGELRSLAVRSRNAKLPQTRGELDAAWHATAAGHGFEPRTVPRGQTPTEDRATWTARTERLLTSERAMFDERTLRTVALEQAAGSGIAPAAALDLARELLDERRVLSLEGGQLTTARVRAMETELEAGVAKLAREERDRRISHLEMHGLTDEQARAVELLAGPSRASLLIGAAGTGKGVVIDAAAQAELDAGRRVLGVAVAGRTAQRLAESSPALADHCRTIDAVLAADTLLASDTTVYVDEAGMGDTERLAALVRAVDEHGASIVLVGDHRQLPAVGAGGMFARLRHLVPTGELTTVHRSADPAERLAWEALRDGDSAVAMAHYRVQGQLRFTDTRVQAVDAAAQRYDAIARERGHEHVALMTDASNAEVAALNLRVQALRVERGELRHGIDHPGELHRLHVGDRVCFNGTLRATGQRVENGALGEIVETTTDPPAATVELDGGARSVSVSGADLELLDLGYAGHVYRQQGATVERAVVVTGGWQTARESAYVEASRAREGVEWLVAREELEGDVDADRVDHLAARMRCSRAQLPSLAREVAAPSLDVAPAPEVAVGAGPDLTP